jgi:hypothetical protein
MDLTSPRDLKTLTMDKSVKDVTYKTQQIIGLKAEVKGLQKDIQEKTALVASKTKWIMYLEGQLSDEEKQTLMRSY